MQYHARFQGRRCAVRGTEGLENNTFGKGGQTLSGRTLLESPTAAPPGEDPGFDGNKD